MKFKISQVMIFSALLTSIGSIQAQNTGTEINTLPSEISEVSPNSEKNKGIMMYATTMRDIYNKERGWYSMYSGDLMNFKKIKTWKPGSQMYIEGLSCGTWGGDNYYAYYEMDYDGGFDYPHAFVTVDVATGDTTIIAQFVEKPGHPTDDTYKEWNPRRIYCMTYDPVKKEIYALGQTVLENNTQVSSLYTVNTKTGKPEKIKDLDYISLAMAVDMAGNLWMQEDLYENAGGQMVLAGCRLNKVETENFKTVESLPLTINGGAPFKGAFFGSMAFDYRTGDLYWTTVTNQNISINSSLFKVDLETGHVVGLGQLYGTYVGLYIPYEIPENPASPRPVSDLNATAGENGALTATLKWKNPKYQWNAQALKDLSEIRVYRENMNSEFISLKATSENIGKEMTWTDEKAKNGINTYYVVPVSNDVAGFCDSIKVYVGEDIPGVIPNIQVVNNDNKVTVTWDAPTEGMNNGYVNPEGLTYTVVRYPDKKEIAKDIKERQVVDSDFSVIDTYSYKIKAKNKLGEGVETESGFVTAGSNYGVPVNLTFDSYENSLSWTAQGGWGWISRFGEGQMLITKYDDVSDNYLFSPAIKFEAGKTYKVKSTIKTYFGPKCIYKFAITMGKDKTAEAQTIELRNETAYSPEQYDYIDELVDYFTPEEDGLYYYAINLTQVIDMDDFALYGLSVEVVNDTDLQANSINAFEAITGIDNTAEVSITNLGSKAATGYKVKVVRKEGEEYLTLGELTEVPEIAVNETKTVKVSYRPDVEGGIELYAIVEIEGDGNSENNISPVCMIPVMPEGTLPFNKEVVDSESDKKETTVPMSFTSTRSISKSIYLAENLGDQSFDMKRLSYAYDNNGADYVLGPINIKIYMEFTDQVKYSMKDTITAPENDDNLVYSGDLSIDPEGKRIVFELDKAFRYEKGKNLCVTMVKDGSVGIDYPLLFKAYPTGNDYRSLVVHKGFTRVLSVPEIYMAVEYVSTGIEDEISVNENAVWYNSESSSLVFSNDSKKNIFVYDINGSLLYCSEAGEGVSVIPVQLSSGVYIVKTVASDGSVNNSKIIVK